MRTKVWYSALQFHLLLGRTGVMWARSVHHGSSCFTFPHGLLLRENGPETVEFGESQAEAIGVFVFFKETHPLLEKVGCGTAVELRYYISFQGAVALAKHKFAEVDGIHSSQQQVSVTWPR